MRIHVIAPFHNVPAQATPCAFAAKARHLPAILHMAGFSTIVEYANEGSESAADERIEMLSTGERQAHFHHGLPIVASPGWAIFDGRLTQALKRQVAPGDFVIHTFGAPHAHLVKDLPDAVHVENGVGYLDKPFGAYRIYESHAWRHFHWGLADSTGTPYLEAENRAASWVVPMSFDPTEWPRGDGAGDEKGPYALFMGRLIRSKGLPVLAELLARVPDLRIKLAGSVTGETAAWHAGLSDDARTRAELIGPVYGGARATLAGDAFCTLMPTAGVEPFGASGIEAAFTGTPLLASNWGAFTETVTSELGLTCGAIEEWVSALEHVKVWTRHNVANEARSRFSLHVAAGRYRRVFGQIRQLAHAAITAHR